MEVLRLQNTQTKWARDALLASTWRWPQGHNQHYCWSGQTSFLLSFSLREEESLEDIQGSQGFGSGLHGNIRAWDVRMDLD